MSAKSAVLLTLLRGIERMAEFLLDHGDYDIIVLYDMAVPYLEKRGIPCRRLKDFLTEDQQQRARDEAERRAKAAAPAVSEMRAQWPQFDDVAFGLLAGEVRELLDHRVGEEVELIEALRRCASETDLRLVVVHQDICRDTKTVVFAARRLGIPALHLAHGFPYGGINSITMRDPSASDIIAVYSERLRDMYEALGVPRERIVVTGNPEWDIHTRGHLPGQKIRACKRMGLDPERPVVTYALTYIDRLSTRNLTHAGYVDQTTEAVVAALAGLSKRRTDWQFVLRPHPNDPDAPANLANLSERFGLENVCIDTETTVVSALAMTDTLVCSHSNMGIEAIIAGKPVVNCAIDEFCKDVFEEGVGPLFLSDDAVILVRETEGIAPAIEAALLDPDARRRFMEARPETLRRFNYLNDGKAMERVCGVMADMIERGHRLVPPVERYPEFEPVLAAAVPEGTGKILVAGRSAHYVADAVRASHAMAHVEERGRPGEAAGGRFDAVVLADPVPHSEDAWELFQAVRACLAGEGALVAVFRHGGNVEASEALSSGKWAPPRQGGEAVCPLGEYSRLGLEIVLSRCDFEIESVVEITDIAAGEGFVRPSGDVSQSEDAFAARLAIDAWVVRARSRVKERRTPCRNDNR